MKEIFKRVSLLYIIHDDSILVRKFRHQDYEVLDVFAFNDDEGVDLGIKNKLMELFGKTFPYKYYGDIQSIINKKEVHVHLDIKTYRVLLDEKYDVLKDYADDVTKSGNDVFWLHKDEIKNEERMREGDRKILERVFDDRNMDIKITEDQGERWIDAKTTLFEDK